MLTFDQFTEDAVASTRRGVSCISQDVLDRITASPVGFYIWTDKTNYAKNQYKIGQSIRGLTRIGEMAQQAERIYVVDWIPSDLAESARILIKP